MSPSPKAFSGLARREPFDWAAFWRTFPWQPVPQWLLLSALAYPASAAFPVLSRATCLDPARAMTVKAALVLYTMLVPPLGSAAVYLLVGHRKIAARPHRLMANVTLALIVVLSAADTVLIVSQVRDQWSTLRPAAASLRAACWPPAKEPFESEERPAPLRTGSRRR